MPASLGDGSSALRRTGDARGDSAPGNSFSRRRLGWHRGRALDVERLLDVTSSEERRASAVGSKRRALRFGALTAAGIILGVGLLEVARSESRSLWLRASRGAIGLRTCRSR